MNYENELQLLPMTKESEEYSFLEVQHLETYLVQENSLIQAVSQGQTAKAEDILSVIYSLVQEEDPRLQHMKNYAVSLNTLLRKFAEFNMINTYQFLNVYSKLNHKIEDCTSPEACYILLREMVRKYCFLAKNHSMKQYSALVQQVIKYVDTDLTADLSLHAAAEHLNVNASYLSTHFKKITGCSYTEYVNRKRIDHSLLLLNTTPLQIQTIAQYCGIPDLNYFSKLFKKYIHQSPSAYRKDLLKK